MSTHCRIGMLNNDGTVTSIYCHWDGYPEGVGAILNRNYLDREKILKLMRLGDLSALGREPIENKDGWRLGSLTDDDKCLTYRSRGENLPAKTTSRDDFYFRFDEEYSYLFDGKQWLVTGSLKDIPLNSLDLK